MSEIIKRENLVILPGLSRSRKSYKKFIQQAQSNWQVFVPSYKILKPYRGINVFISNLLTYFKENSLDKVHLLGHSLGGGLALHFAVKHQDRLKGLFLVDSKGIYESESLGLGIKNLIREHLKRSLVGNIEDFFRIIANPILNFRLGHLAHYLDAKAQAGQIKVDTSIFWGENDCVVPASHGKRLKSLIKNSKLYILKGLGHDWIFDHSNHFWEKIRA